MSDNMKKCLGSLDETWLSNNIRENNNCNILRILCRDIPGAWVVLFTRYNSFETWKIEIWYIMIPNVGNDISDYNLFIEHMIGCKTYAID